MQYISTRGGVLPVEYLQTLTKGQADDGGLFLPAEYPDFKDRLNGLRDLSFADLAVEIILPFMSEIDRDTISAICRDAFATFDHPDVTPLVQHGDLHILELYHGPTLAFKDIALQVLGRLFEHVLSERHQVMNIVGATSGDTGSAAIASVRGREGLGIFIMFPDGRTSHLQELQMTTVLESNVHCLAIDGSFDDCQRILKELFNDIEFKTEANLGAVNSINWTRILLQMVYYFYAALQYDEPVTFSVPTGNFGNVLSGILAMRIGAPIRKLVVGTNENDILTRFFSTGRYRLGEVHQTLSPSMDIQVSSNLERFVYMHLDGDADRLVEFMTSFARQGHSQLNQSGKVDRLVDAFRVDTDLTIDTIKDTWDQYDQLIDPHTAVGVAASRLSLNDGPVVCLATAHPAKFPDAVKQATGTDLAKHPSLDALDGKQSRKVQLKAKLSEVRAYLEANVLSA